jgi:calpain-15
MPSRIARLFEDDQVDKTGCYEIWLNIDGKWKQIVVDDTIPCAVDPKNPGALRPAFAKTKGDVAELWVMLLEKAYAKAYGSYRATIGGKSHYALRDMTGASYSTFPHAD